MSAPRTMALAVTQSQRLHRQVAQEMRELQVRRQMASQQLEQLQAYALEVQQNFLRHARRHLQVNLLQQHHQFAARLDDAIGRQLVVIDELNVQIDHVHSQLLACEQRMNVLQRWMDRHALQLTLQEARREQKMNDDMALRAGHGWLLADRGRA